MKQLLLVGTSLAAFMIFAGPAAAEVQEPRGLNHPMRQTLRDIDQVKSEAEDIWILSRYCIPQEQPSKKPTRDALSALEARLKALTQQLAAYERSYRDAGDTRLEAGIQAAFPPVNGMLPQNPNGSDNNAYWGAANNYAREAQKVITAKKDSLRKAPEEDCRKRVEPDKTERDVIGGGGGQPPVKQEEPPQEELWGPKVVMDLPVLQAIILPSVPDYFCSLAEKAEMLALIDPAKAKAQAQADVYEAHAQAVEARKAELIAKGLPDHWQRAMDYQAAQARKLRDDRLTMLPYLENVRKLIANTEVRDCAPKAKDALKTGWDLKFGVDYGTGDLDLAQVEYLGVENPVTSERINGVIQGAKSDGGAERIGAAIELPVGLRMPNIFAPFGGQLVETRLRGALGRTHARTFVRGDFDPMGDRLFVPGLTGEIADTFVLPSTFDATIRDNRIDGFWADTRYRRSSLSFGFAEDFVFPDCNDFTLTKSFGLMQSWQDRRDGFQADVLDYFPVVSPGFDVRAEYDTFLDSSTTAVKLGYDGKWSPKSWGGVFVSAGLDGWVGYTDSDASAYRRLDIDGGVNEQWADAAKSEATFGYGLRASAGIELGSAKIELGVEYRQDGDTPVVNYGAGVPLSIEHDDREQVIGTLRTTFTF